jgi:hypothetical protein
MDQAVLPWANDCLDRAVDSELQPWLTLRSLPVTRAQGLTATIAVAAASPIAVTPNGTLSNGIFKWLVVLRGNYAN